MRGFSTKSPSARIALNPQMSEAVDMPAATTLVSMPGTALENIVNADAT